MDRKYYKAIIETVLTLVSDWSSDSLDWLISELQELSASKFDKELEEMIKL
jgi:hypothetical protein